MKLKLKTSINNIINKSGVKDFAKQHGFLRAAAGIEAVARRRQRATKTGKKECRNGTPFLLFFVPFGKATISEKPVAAPLNNY